MPNGENAALGGGHFGELKRRWAWMLAFGVMTLGLGLVGLGMATFITLASVMFYGIILLVSGGGQFIQSFQCGGWKAKLWHALISLLYVFAGIVVIRNPLLVSGIFTLMLAGAITAVGIARIVLAFRMKGEFGWLWVMFGGVLALVLGILIFARWPASSLVVIGTFISIELIINGWSIVTVALAARMASKRA